MDYQIVVRINMVLSLVTLILLAFVLLKPSESAGRFQPLVAVDSHGRVAFDTVTARPCLTSLAKVLKPYTNPDSILSTLPQCADLATQ